VHYLDTSAFLELLVDGEHSDAVRTVLEDGPVWSSTLLAVEAHRAGRRLGLPRDAVARALEVVSLVLPSATTYATAETVGTDELRALDALHLASALELGADLDALVTYDRRLAAGGHAAGLTIVAPGRPAAWWER
jgi:hypothetical protein